MYPYAMNALWRDSHQDLYWNAKNKN
jgi:hypothetical protein